MKTYIVAAALAATTAMTFNAPEADARRGFHGGGFRVAVVHRPHFHRHRVVRYGFVAPAYYGPYCKWYRTPYGSVRRCWY